MYVYVYVYIYVHIYIYKCMYFMYTLLILNANRIIHICISLSKIRALAIKIISFYTIRLLGGILIVHKTLEETQETLKEVNVLVQYSHACMYPYQNIRKIN